MIRKIAYFHYQCSERDGSYVHTREFEAAFRRLCEAQGIRFDVVAPELVAHAPTKGGIFSGLKSRLSRFYLRDFKTYLKQLARSRQEGEILRRERPDIVLTRFDSSTLSVLWACRREGIPVVIEFNAPEWDEMGGEYRQLPWFRKMFTNRHALELADGAFTVSDEIGRPLLSHTGGRKRVVTIANGVDVERFDPSLSPRPVRERWNIPEGRVVLGFIGSFAPWHGLDMLVDAFEDLLAEGLPVHLLLVGQASPQWQALLDRLRSPSLANHVTLAGFVAPADIPPYLAAMDVAVLANAAYYCSPLKLFEYMAMARPIVAAATGPVAATLADGKEGLLFPVGDGQALARALRSLVVSPEKRAAFGAAARGRVEAEFTWKHNAERVFELLQGVWREARENAARPRT